MCQNVKVPFVLLPPQIPDDPDPYPSPKNENVQASNSAPTVSTVPCSRRAANDNNQESQSPLPTTTRSAAATSSSVQPQCSIDASISEFDESGPQ